MALMTRRSTPVDESSVMELAPLLATNTLPLATARATGSLSVIGVVAPAGSVAMSPGLVRHTATRETSIARRTTLRRGIFMIDLRSRT